LSKYVDHLWGPYNLLFIGFRGMFPPEIKGPRSKAKHSPPFSAEVEKDDYNPLRIWFLGVYTATLQFGVFY